jgi:hypothetical protein
MRCTIDICLNYEVQPLSRSSPVRCGGQGVSACPALQECPLESLQPKALVVVARWQGFLLVLDPINLATLVRPQNSKVKAYQIRHYKTLLLRACPRYGANNLCYAMFNLCFSVECMRDWAPDLTADGIRKVGRPVVKSHDFDNRGTECCWRDD